MREAGVRREKSRFHNNVVTFKFPKQRVAQKDDEDDEDDEMNGRGGGGGGGTSRLGSNKETTTTTTTTNVSSSSSDGRGGRFFRWRGTGEMSLALLLCLSLVDDAAVIAAPYLLSHLPGR